MNAIFALFLAITVAGSAGSLPTSKRQAATEWNQDGLQKTKVKGFELAYVRPGATLAGYRRVQLAPVSVAFRRGFGERTGFDSTREVDAEDMQRMRERLSALMQEVVAEELAQAGYTLADAPGPDVLAVRMSVVNLYLNAPDVDMPGLVDVYTTSVGEMTLVAELEDSGSGETLMRLYDRREGHYSQRPERTTRADNAHEARLTVRGWAKALVRSLGPAETAGGAR